MKWWIGLFALASLSTAQVAFEVSSVKPSGSGGAPEFGCSPSGRFVSRGTGLRSTLLFALGAKYFQVTGLPKWIDDSTGMYDIEAKSAGAATEQQCRAMVLTLLTERFRLSIHKESRDFPVYALRVAKAGIKMTEASSDGTGGVRLSVNGRDQGPAPGAPRGTPPAAGWTMPQLVNFLNGPFLDRPVVDSTGLTGVYRLNLAFSFSFPGGPPNPDAADPDLLAALPLQLGLELRRENAPMEMYAIDRLERPDLN